MWNRIVNYILRRRALNLIVIGLLTVFMGYQALKVKMSYEYAQMLPMSDSTSIIYQDFKKQFEEDGSVLFVGIQDEKLKKLEVFNDWCNLSHDLKNIKGVGEVMSIAHCLDLQKDTAAKKFKIVKLFETNPSSQAELDSILKKAYSMPFYDEMLFSKENGTNVMMVYIDKKVLNSKERDKVLIDIKEPIEEFGVKHEIEMHFSGMPYIRTSISNLVQKELKVFMILALIVASIILLVFFRSLKALVFSITTVIIGVIWAVGTMVLMGFDITILSGIIPPILIIIGIENCIYLITKYHYEFAQHGNQAKSLARVVQRVGLATFLTNATTAVGFGSFMVTSNPIMVEFGIIACVSILLEFLFTLILIPTMYSLFPPPKGRHIKHLDFTWLNGATRFIINTIQYKRNLVLVAVIILLTGAGFGISLIENKGSVVDDVPKGDKLYTDMLFFEDNMGGVLPLEITVDTKKKKGILNLNTLKKIDKFQTELKEIPAISKPLSVVEIVKFAKQSFFNGRPDMYSLPNDNEKAFILSYLPDIDKGGEKNSILSSFIDTNYQVARISIRLKNVYTPEIKEIKDTLESKLARIFPAEKYKTVVTGSAVVFEKGSNYLVSNLYGSLALAIVIIALLIYILFSNVKMVFIAMTTNMIPLLVTAGLMGFLNVDLKPSTIIIYSIALGISVDAAIQFLSRYRHQLKMTDWNIRESVLGALKETTSGMIFSGIVLVLGFGVFIFSRFGGTASLGYLIGFTLLIALFSNLIILPSLILYMDKLIKNKEASKTLFDVEENDDPVLPPLNEEQQ
ncbi:MAG TPA: MMPL family transporter [Bacteroidales bacterium]|nr:MMPL family transporter [Bacteroidales bacterium]